MKKTCPNCQKPIHFGEAYGFITHQYSAALACPHCKQFIAFKNSTTASDFFFYLLVLIPIAALLGIILLLVAAIGGLLGFILLGVLMLALAFFVAPYWQFKTLKLSYPLHTFFCVRDNNLYFHLEKEGFDPDHIPNSSKIFRTELSNIGEVRMDYNYITISLKSKHSFALDCFFDPVLFDYLKNQLIPFLADDVKVTLNKKVTW